MKGKPKNLPVGNSDFKDIIEGGSLYIDKTEIVLRLIKSGKYYFLSRPRRFGKSLLISTLYHIFRGDKELFKGLYIYDTDYKWEEHPIIRLDFNGITNNDKKSMEKDLRIVLKKIGQEYGVEPEEGLSIKLYFKDLIEKISDKYDKGVVFLIDEYDKPIIDHIGKGEEELRIAEDNREFLKNFYGLLKETQVVSKTRFVFITGVTKFSKVSIFSELNNLTDLTMLYDYNELLGITEEEIDRYLTPHIEYFCEDKGKDCKELREELRNYYNGYRFSEKETRVYNPFSLFSALENRVIKNFWFETGTPTFLVNLIKEQNIYLPKYENFEATESVFSTYELSRLSVLPLMFQTGYLTIKDYKEVINLYELGFPNKEVKVSFNENLYYELSELREDTKFKRAGLSFEEGDIDRAMDLIKSIYSEIPYTLMRKDRINENYFHTIFYLIITASGVSVRTEVLNYRGRIDLLIETKKRYYIIEFKCNQNADKAIQQIREKRYYEPYLDKGKEIILIGINFSTEKKNIEEYLTEKI